MTNTFTGDATNNYLVSANGDDVIYGYDGFDALYGRGGDDLIFGGNDEDRLFGEDDDDTLDGGADGDRLDGGYGNDTLIGGDGVDIFTVDDDSDVITDLGFGGADVFSVGTNGTLTATVVQAWTAMSKTTDEGTAHTTNDGIVNLITAGFAVDLSLALGSVGFTVTNTGGVTTLTGSAQADTLKSGAGADMLIGGDGDDTLISIAHTATAIYSGAEADYTLTKLGGGAWRLVDINLDDGNSGTDTLIGVPTVQFADGVVELPVNRAPDVAAEIANQTFNEDSPLSFRIPAGTFSDPDSDPLVLSATLADGSALPEWLSFDAGTRTFSGTPPQNFNGQIALKVSASDGEFQVADDFTLTVRAVSDAPMITSGGGGTTASYAVLENTVAVGQITASDPDAGAYQRYTIVGGADADLFKIGYKSGALTFIAGQNFESPADANGDGVYDVVVKASDGRLFDLQTLQVTVTNLTNEVLSGTSADNTLRGADGADRLYGLSGSDTLNGGAGNDRLYGGQDNDLLSGSLGNDRVYGGLGNDTLLGGAGNDQLFGGAGQDVLTGGSGRDTFTFDLSPGTPGNVDVISDFSHALADTIALSLADFTGFAETGRISADQFYAAAGATSAQDADDRIIYNTTNGALYYDADGEGGSSAVQFARIQSHATANLGYYDILIVA